MNYIIIFLVALLPLKSLSQYNLPAINILDAINKKAIDYKSSGIYDLNNKVEYIDANGQYYGKCMQIKLHNNSVDSLYIYIKEGLLLKSDDSVIQDMLITKPLYVLMGPKQTKSYPLYAMCSEMHDKIPTTQTNYSIAQNTDENLVLIAEKINSAYLQNVIGQGAIWLYTDNAGTYDLKRYGATEKTIEGSLNLLAEAGIKTKLSEEIHYSPKSDEGKRKDSLIIALTNELDYKSSVLKYKSDSVELDPVLFYSGLGILVILSGTCVLLLVGKNKDRAA